MMAKSCDKQQKLISELHSPKEPEILEPRNPEPHCHTKSHIILRRFSRKKSQGRKTTNKEKSWRPGPGELLPAPLFIYYLTKHMHILISKEKIFAIIQKCLSITINIQWLYGYLMVRYGNIWLNIEQINHTIAYLG